MKYRLYYLVLCFFFAFSTLNAQVKPSDSLDIRKEYSLPDPTIYEAYYDVSLGVYLLYPKIGNVVVGAPVAMSPKEYGRYITTNQLRAYYREKSNAANLVHRKDKTDAQKKGLLLPSLTIKNKVFESIFGGNKIELIPQGFASFDVGALYQKIDNPLILPQNRKNFSFDIQQRIQLSLLAKVGENLQLKANYDTQSGFAFENKMNLTWQSKGTWQDLQQKLQKKVQQGKELLNSKTVEAPVDGGEDRIIKKVEFGNVNMPLSTSLIRGSESLFGLKTEFQLGKTRGTVVLSQQQGEARNVVVQGGGALQTFKLNAYDYEDNQHYFLGHYFLNQYDNALAQYPLINSKINITRLEVWVLEQGSGNLSEQKSILGIRDLGEGAGYPQNGQNNLYNSVNALGASIRDVSTAYNTIKGQSFPNANGTNETYQDGEQFVFNRRARRLNSNEYTLQPQLGYISLNQRLSDNQLLAVSYSYTLAGDTQVYKVGEFSEESPVVITKLLKPNNVVKTTSPMWDLMMKNIYALNANQISSENFMLNIYYRNPKTGGKINYLPVNGMQDQTLLKLFNWDRLNQNNDTQNDGSGGLGDGLFDFVQGITISPDNGKLIFTKAQPFGKYLQNILGSNDPQYVFSELYTQLKTVVENNSNLAQRYTIEGRYKGSQGNGISLGAINIPPGSVKVTANGVQLTEGQDYTVDYMLGQVYIINEQVKNSGQALNISLENQLIFNTQRRRFLGLNLERKFNENLMIGATVVNYSERPLTQKVNFGQEAVNNTMTGFNMMYNNELPFLTRITNKLPMVKTDAPSNLNFKAEAAYLIPGQNSGIDGQAYIDDFEQTSSKISLKDPAFWSLASKPENNKLPPYNINSGLNDDIKNGYGRGLLSWYNIDPRFYGIGGKAPAGINPESVSNHASRRVKMSELFNNRDYVAGEQTFTNTFDITYYPTERGPYNLNTNPEAPSSRWAGLMRSISVSNFVSANIEYVEFWMMDPYADGKSLGASPKLRLQLGNVSEDVLKDGKLQYENGLPTSNQPNSTSMTNWGSQPNQFPVLYAFSTEDERSQQDVGYDGLNNEQEAQKFGTNFINPVTGNLDPASDDFVFYLSTAFPPPFANSVIDRYRYFRNPEGNSQANSLEVATQLPDAEDINRDYNLDQTELYNQYTIDLDRASLSLNQNFIVDEKEVSVRFENGQTSKNKWYLFRVPVSQFDNNVDGSSEAILNNVRYARILLDGFEETSTLRFGTFDLVRSDWRKYNKTLAVVANDVEGVGNPSNENFFVGSVNLEENANGNPPYVLPPGIERQVLSGNAGVQRQNESSLYLKLNTLPKREARGVVKNTNLDMRRYRNLELFVHAEDLRNLTNAALDLEAKFFIRFGSDATDNYYEYETSLKYTPQNARSPMEIWPSQNTINLEVQNFVNAKMKRDALNQPNIMQTRYHYADFGDADKKVFVKGRPSLGSITTIMIGVRNTSATTDKDMVVWVDEVRLSGIENKGGYAANASIDFNLGDFAMLNANASISTVGFGSIDQKPAERAQTEKLAFGINTTINADKFLPEKTGMKIPVNYSYSQTIEDPKYNPLDNDVEFKNAPNRAELKQIARTYTQQRSIGVVNMRKERVDSKKKPKFYDVENLSVTAVYNDDYSRDIYTSRNYAQYLRGSIDYNFTFKPWVVKPFKNIVSDTAKAYKYLRWAKEFNFNPVPTRISFRTEIDRNYNELQYRNIEAILSGNPGSEFDVIRNRNFYFGWQYNLGFNFTKSLKMEINSATRTLNDHANVNAMNSNSIFNHPFRAGRPVLYNHRVQLNYKFPFEYLPYLDFMRAEFGYGVQYNWNSRSSAIRNSPNGNLGNIAQNSNNITATSSVDIPKLFSKFKYFAKINDVMTKRRQEIDSLNNVYEQALQKKGKKAGFKAYKFKNKLTSLQSIAYALTSFKQLDINYNETNGSTLPGLLSAPNWYGYGQTIGGPTVGFLFGSQADVRRIAVQNGWISGSDLMIDPYLQSNTKSLDMNLQVAPINDLRIDITANNKYNRNYTQSGFNYVNTATNYVGYRDAFATETITQSRSAWMISTAFKDPDEVYHRLQVNARILSQQLGDPSTTNAAGFTEGYSITNAYILIPAFQAAVEGGSVKAMKSPKKLQIPLPNWKLTYSGLRNIPFINHQFSKFDILHGYTATYTGGGIQSSTEYFNNRFDASARDLNGNRYNPYSFSQVGYVESFAPLIGADVTMRNNMQFRAQLNKDRTYLLGLVNNTLTEDHSNEYIVGFGYIIKDLKMKLNFKGKSTTIKSDLNLRGDLSLRNSKTLIRNILLNDSQITGGQTLLSIKISADYNMSQNLNLRFFYDQMLTKYKISTAFPLSTIRAGISATLTFGGAGAGATGF